MFWIIFSRMILTLRYQDGKRRPVTKVWNLTTKLCGIHRLQQISAMFQWSNSQSIGGLLFCIPFLVLSVHGLATWLHTIQSWTHAAAAAAAAAALLQLCLTLCDPTDGSPPGSPVPEILQARILEWVAISFSNVWKWSLSVVSDS